MGNQLVEDAQSTSAARKESAVGAGRECFLACEYWEARQYDSAPVHIVSSQVASRIDRRLHALSVGCNERSSHASLAYEVLVCFVPTCYSSSFEIEPLPVF